MEDRVREIDELMRREFADAAQKRWIELLQVTARSAQDCINLGLFAHQRQWHHLGEIAFRRAVVAIDPDCGDAWNNIGIALNDQGKSQEGESYVRRALTINDRNPDYWLNLGAVLLARVGVHLVAVGTVLARRVVNERSVRSVSTLHRAKAKSRLSQQAVDDATVPRRDYGT